jgi:hypothetical protein
LTGSAIVKKLYSYRSKVSRVVLEIRSFASNSALAVQRGSETNSGADSKSTGRQDEKVAD